MSRVLFTLVRHELARMFQISGILLKLGVGACYWFLADWVADGSIVVAAVVLVPVASLAGLVGWLDTAETTVDGTPAWRYAASRPLHQAHILRARKIALSAGGALLALSFLAGLLLSEEALALATWGFLLAPAAWFSVLVGGWLREE